jgi:hypothetical protein
MRLAPKPLAILLVLMVFGLSCTQEGVEDAADEPKLNGVFDVSVAEVPNVVGDALGIAEQRLISVGFFVRTHRIGCDAPDGSGEFPGERVSSQVPSPGEDLQVNAFVVLTVCRLEG